jgi:hypothetical protein
VADLNDGLLRALDSLIQAGQALAIIAAGSPWTCCIGVIERGPAACTCWRPVYDLDQTDPDPDTVIALVLGTEQPPTRHRMCEDCAYRPNSPERSGDERMAGDADELERLAATGTRFWCHDGMRRPIAWRHPLGMRIPAAGDGDYQPPIIEGIPWRADGSPGLLCAGWSARHRALTGKTPAAHVDTEQPGTPARHVPPPPSPRAHTRADRPEEPS